LLATSFVTTAPAPIIAFFPILTPGKIVAPPPIVAPSQIVVFGYFFALLSLSRLLLGYKSLVKVTLGPIKTLSSMKMELKILTPFLIVTLSPITTSF